MDKSLSSDYYSRRINIGYIPWTTKLLLLFCKTKTTMDYEYRSVDDAFPTTTYIEYKTLKGVNYVIKIEQE